MFRRPRSAHEWIALVTRVVALVVVPALLLYVLSPLLARPWTLGQHNWDQMEMHRYVADKTILDFHQFPFWNPYTCGGHAAWGALEADPTVVSPWLPAYLALPLPIAMRVEIFGSAIWGAIGAWLLASRFTTSRILRALLPVIFAVNSRWALQLAAGHSWHLLYGCTPWILYLYDRALHAAKQRERDVCVLRAGVLVAVVVYGCGIYPAPHTAFALGCYALLMAWAMRSLRPIWLAMACVAIGIGLAGPKLVPTLEGLLRYPRLIKSQETLNPDGLLGALTWRIGDYKAEIEPTVEGMWHEWGMYLGWPGLLALVAGLTFVRGPRARALAWTGVIMASMVFGAFAWFAPWAILHHLPVFGSQHVPSRWLYPSLVPLACAAVAGGDRALRLAGRWRVHVEAGLAVLAVVMVVDMGSVARQPIAESFVESMPHMADSTGPFRMLETLPDYPDYRPGVFDVQTLPAPIQNIGTTDCNTVSPLHNHQRPKTGPVPGLGARGIGDPDYRGEAYVDEGQGTAEMVAWSPNEMEVSVRGARAGEHLVLNQNWDPGWMANGVPVLDRHDAVATTLDGPVETVRFTYRPRTWPWGLGVLALTLASLAAAAWTRSRSGAEREAGGAVEALARGTDVPPSAA